MFEIPKKVKILAALVCALSIIAVMWALMIILVSS